jgi:hypothetical protein
MSSARSARQTLSLRCTVRRRPAGYRPGCSACSFSRSSRPDRHDSSLKLEFGAHCRERISPPALAFRLGLGLRGRAHLAGLPGRSQPGQKGIERRRHRRQLRRVGDVHQPLLGCPQVAEQADRLLRGAWDDHDQPPDRQLQPGCPRRTAHAHVDQLPRPGPAGTPVAGAPTPGIAPSFATADCAAPFFDNSGAKALGFVPTDRPEDHLSDPSIAGLAPEGGVFGLAMGGSYAATNYRADVGRLEGPQT